MPRLAFTRKREKLKIWRNYAMSENERRKEELIRRLDNLEACKDNPVYLAEIKEIRKELADINCEQ
jgi:intein/homing endonuclease